MIFKVKENCRYAIASPTSMGLRITPVNRQPVHNSSMFYMQATSAETNVVNISAALGKRGLALTKFVKDSELSLFIKNQLRARNIDFAGSEVEAGGPWGYRHHINVADSGFGLRGPRVLNDRAGEVGRTMSADEFDTKKIFEQDGVAILHLSGLVAALSQQTTECCCRLAEIAKANGTLVSFDLNYRASFWVGREDELRQNFKKIAAMADILVGNEEDFQLALGIQGPESGGKELADKVGAFKEMIGRVKAEYPNARLFANTLRQVINANCHNWGALMLAEDEWFVEEPREIPIMDRIGGGDAFVGGLLYGVLQGWPPQKWLQFAWATGVLATTSLNDYAEPCNEAQVWDIYAGNARVKR